MCRRLRRPIRRYAGQWNRRGPVGRSSGRGLEQPVEEETRALAGVDLFEAPDPFPVDPVGAEIAAQQIGRRHGTLIACVR